jgi:tetratricopeptide (TPR) repeat protein
VLAAYFLLAAAAALWIVPTEVAAQDTDASLQLSPQQALDLARQALVQGNIPLADAISTALLERDPDDADALMIRSLAARAAGAFDIAEEAAAQAYRISEIPALRFDAAFLIADIKARKEHFTRAQFWLRRADNVAPDDQRRAAVTRAYQTVTRRNPLGVQLRFTVRPSNNVNNGAETLIIELGGLPFNLDPSAQQLSGYEASTGVSLTYRLSEDETQKTEALAELFHRKIWLSSRAKELAPDVDGSDFDYSVVVAGIRQQRLIWPDLGITQITGLFGQSWYGSEELARWGALRLGQTVRQSDVQQLRFGSTIRSEKRLDDDVNSSNSIALSVDLTRAAESGGAFGFGTTFKNVWSDSATVDLSSIALRAYRSFDQIGAIQPRLSASVEKRNYHEFNSVAGGRDDITMSLGVNVTLPDVSYFGFLPQLSLLSRRTWSTVDIYDRKEISFGVTAVSRF